MKKYILAFAVLFTSLSVIAQTEGYNPINPPLPDNEYFLTVKFRPETNGYGLYLDGKYYDSATSYDSLRIVREYADIGISWTARSGLRFKYWEDSNGIVVSDDSWFTYRMSSRHATLTAVFEYSPSNPPLPDRNFYDSGTGELILDDFSPNDLTWIIEESSYEYDIRKIVVSGSINPGCLSIRYGNLDNCTTYDFSRTAGTEYIPSYCYYQSNFPKEILFPLSVSRVESYAFYESSIESLTFFSPVPPVLGEEVFSNCNIIVYVPARSVSLYMTADGWKDYADNGNITILPIRNEVASVEVNLPYDESIGNIYKNMYIELTNVKSGQRYKYIVTDRISYTFSNLIKGTQYKATLTNQDGVLLSEITGISVEDCDVQVCFTDIKDITTISATVNDADGTDVTSQVSISWYSYPDGIAGTLLSQGPRISGIVAGTELICRVTLNQDLGMSHILPQDVAVTTGEDDVTINLQPIPLVTLNGRILDLTDETPLSGASVTVIQTVNDKYSKSYATRTAADGIYSITVSDAPGIITYSAPDYISKRNELGASILSGQSIVQLEDVCLKSITGAVITTNFTYTASVKSGSGVITTEGYEDYENISYRIYNVTKDQPITDFSVQYPKIVLLEPVDENDRISVTAVSKVGKFNDVTSEGQIDEKNSMSVLLPIVQLGGIDISFNNTENSAVIAVLYDETGKLLTRTSYKDKSAAFQELPDGTYSVLSMGTSDFFSSIYNIDNLTQAGLTEGTDFVKNRITVKSGQISTARNVLIPFFDETRLYYTGNNTAFSVNKSSIVTGNYLTFQANVDFKEEFVEGISNVELIFELPEGTRFVDNSLMKGSSAFLYEHDGNLLSVKLGDDYTDRIRFCAIPTSGGSYEPSAFVKFNFDGKTIRQPIGSSYYEVKELDITVPKITSKERFTISGVTTPNSTLEIYDGNELIGQTKSLSNGVWSASCELNSPENLSEHSIFAKVTTKDGMEMQTETRMIIYDRDAIEVENVHMYHWNPEMNKNYDVCFDFQNPSVVSQKYIYYIYNRQFTFTVSLTDNEAVQHVFLRVYTGNGTSTIINATYDKTMDCWVAEGEFGNMYDGNIPKNVDVSLDDCISWIGSNNPNADPAIDPSGYVYEAVHSNRIEDVTATAFYKETTTDMYGEKHDRIILWDASEYAQENPQFTDEQGMYRWDVPEGLWQVKFEKNGYVTTYSEWLPVPPPQLEINIPMTANVAPEVISAKAYTDCVEIEFSKYIKSSTITEDNIYLLGITDEKPEGEYLAESIELIDGEIGINDETYATKVRIKTSMLGEDYDRIELKIGTGIMSYSGLCLESAYSQELDVEKKVKKIVVDDITNVEYGGNKTVIAGAILNDGDPASGKTLIVKSASELYASISAVGYIKNDNGEIELILDENGQAQFLISGSLLGTTSLILKIKDTDVSASTIIKVVDPAKMQQVADPTASLIDGSMVYRGQAVTLFCETLGSSIYYTTDGTEPEPGVSRKYDGHPIVINSDMTLKAISVGLDTDNQSEVKTFVYKIRQTDIKLNLAEGWNWNSHNLASALAPDDLTEANIRRIQSQTGEIINDPILGFIGNISSIDANSAIKIETTSEADINLQGEQYNPSARYITLHKGWNWLGFPIGQTMLLKDAFMYLNAEDGDCITGLTGGYAIFEDGIWTGELTQLTPGHGYLYKSVSEKSFVYNTVPSVPNARALMSGKLPAVAPWGIDEHKYPNVMCVTAVISDKHFQEIDAENYWIGAFADDECRGIGKLINGRIYLSIHGTINERLKFKIIDKSTGAEYAAEEALSFKADKFGSLNNPYIITLTDGAVTGIATVSDSLSGNVYNINGTEVRASDATHGLYIIDGVKTFNK